ncbi:sugar phosphate isomerase/epimerase family protein [Cyclobacterium marinum]|uniref:Xylose isomerase domain-containing protein TIM barrel n=1 Tax=Cyclobacterium marinum (strain ATCC 25205 / DSM 745 / LMG 13164 / NCIMB 1802) TaxID=880070 RepID=G0IUR0_CYCMS|nr:sugar phosphate isomerase/epimerase [Cyclobacterium marinum]AEL25452.1 Xylose isomerase domain-containing protein TIM barrel [Cyclobacterium marinum DSM 745]
MKNLSLFLIIGIFASCPLIMTAKAQEIGLQLYSLRNQMKMDVEKNHELIQQWGIRYIEGGSTYGMSDKKYKALLAKYNLQMISVGGAYDELTNDPEAVIKRAKAFGSKYIVTFWIPHDGEFDFEKAKEATTVFNAFGKKAKEEGLTFCYHPHGYEFKTYGEGTVFDYMLDNATDFKFEMDVFWVKMGGGDPLAILKAHPNKFPLLHLKDRKKGTPGSSDGTGDVESNVVLGKGDIDIKNIILQAKKGGTQFFIIEDESSKSVAQIPQSVYYINQTLNN